MPTLISTNEVERDTESDNRPSFYNDFIKGYGAFNQKRLTAVQISSITSVLFKNSFLPKHFGLLGLAYIFRLSVDVFNFAYETFKYNKKINKNYYEQIKENFKKEAQDKDRLLRMSNDAIWFSINLATLLINPLVAIGLTIAGFTFDTIAGLINIDIQFKKQLAFEDKVKTLTQLQNDKLSLQTELSTTLTTEKELELNNQLEQTKEKIKDLKIEMNKIKKNNPDIEKDKFTILGNNFSDLALGTILATGLVLTLWPLTMPAGAGLLIIGLSTIGLQSAYKTWDHYHGNRSGLVTQKEDTKTQHTSTSILQKSLKTLAKNVGTQTPELLINQSNETKLVRKTAVNLSFLKTKESKKHEQASIEGGKSFRM